MRRLVSGKPCRMRAVLVSVLAAAGVATGREAPAEELTVTATREPVAAAEVPAMVTVISGDQIRQRGLRTLAELLAGVPGTEGSAGGDSGPASATPAFWGLHEFDAFLLVVDGVPFGGAYNPAIADLDLNDVERVEVVKGPAPVLYGATSFVGVVHLIHRAAGTGPATAELAVGTRGSFAASASTPVSSGAGLLQSLSLATERRGLDEARASTAHTRLLYRAAAPLAGGTFAMDAGAALGRDHPGSPRLYDLEAGTPLTPVDANFNPGGAQLSSDRYQLRLAYDHLTAHGSWSAAVSVARTQVTDLRGFLHPDDSGLVDVQDQARRLTDAYLDIHYTWIAGLRLHVTAGVDALYGTARQLTRNANDAYVAALDGSGSLPQASGLATNEAIRLHDVRRFLGQYLQLEARPGPRWTALLGLRLNEVSEDKDGSVLDLASGDDQADAARRSTLRGSFSAGVTHALLDADRTPLATFADYRTAFKPAALDFGPDYTPGLLAPESSRTLELGLRGALGSTEGESTIRYELALFRSQFANLVVPTDTGALANAAAQRLQGVEAELDVALARKWSVTTSGAYHESQYLDYTSYDSGQAVNLAGRLLPLAPRFLGAATLEYGSTGDRWSGGLTLRYAGRRFLDPTNAVGAGGYATLDARVALALGPLRVTLEGSNLSDCRPPTVASEFGASSYYLLPGRRVWLRLDWDGGRSPNRGT